LVAAGRRCARFDQRGFDPAVRPSAVEDYRIELLTADVVDVLDGLGWPQAVVVGHDWGAVVAWSLAASAPERVTRLVALSVPHPGAFTAALRTDEDQRRRSAYIQLFQIEGKAEDVLLADDAAALRRVYAGLGPAQAAHYLERFGDRDMLTATLSWYRAMDRGSLAGVPVVGVPTCFVWGEAVVAVGRTAAEACGAWVSGDYRFVELVGAGLWVPETTPRAVVDAILTPHPSS
jgi:pimeloyl-ACP methyl ester carboxylesterase